jgi:hypothetical protein
MISSPPFIHSLSEINDLTYRISVLLNILAIPVIIKYTFIDMLESNALITVTYLN